MNKSLLLLAAAVIVTATAAARNLRVEISSEHDLWWNAPEMPCVRCTFTDTLGRAGRSQVTLRVAADRDRSRDLFVLTQEVDLRAGASAEAVFRFAVPEPGFYRCTIEDDGNPIRTFNIGYEPTCIISLPDARADFWAFWDRALAELAAVDGNYTITEDRRRSGRRRKAYAVEMTSLGGVRIKALLLLPVAPGKYPAHICYNGYGAEPWEVDPDARPDWIELLTSVRGQFYSRSDNTYGDWIRYRLDDPEAYYYRGAYMDAVRAVDFVASLPQTDTAAIFAEGGSQGGALALAAAALGGRLRAIAPYIPFLSDFRDYFRIVDWPASAIRDEAARLGMTEEKVCENLTYFDMKNLARRIRCPVLMGIGLQDPTCPPHTNLSSYNLLTVPKELVIYPMKGHTVDYGDWNPRRDRFFGKMLGR